MIFVSSTADGEKITFHDRKRYWWILSVLAPSLPAISAFYFWLTENPLWALHAPLIYFGVIPLLDWWVGEDTNNPPEEVVEQLAADNYYRILLHCTVPVYYISFLSTAYILGTYELPIWAYVAFSVGAGIASGAGLTVGHELGHKQSRLDQLSAKLVNALTGYAHFCIEHNRGHHTHVATPEDIASSKLGESVYQFAARELPGALKRGWAMEKRRLTAKKLPFWSLRHNDLLQGYALAAVLGLGLIALFGWVMLPFLIIHHIFGWLQLTFANYVEHYGLKREKLPNGKYEPCQPKHSWNTNHIVSNLALFHLQRHSDHHANPMRPYQALRNFDELPRLPSGYPGSYLLATIPPLWFKVMNPKVMKWAGGDIEKTNYLK